MVGDYAQLRVRARSEHLDGAFLTGHAAVLTRWLPGRIARGPAPGGCLANGPSCGAGGVGALPSPLGPHPVDERARSKPCKDEIGRDLVDHERLFGGSRFDDCEIDRRLDDKGDPPDDGHHHEHAPKRRISPSNRLLAARFEQTSCPQPPPRVNTAPHPGIVGAGHLLGLAAPGRTSKRWEEVGNIADRLLETGLRRSQRTIWPFTTAVAIAWFRACGCLPVARSLKFVERSRSRAAALDAVLGSKRRR
jgi:hypothetical protein